MTVALVPLAINVPPEPIGVPLEIIESVALCAPLAKVKIGARPVFGVNAIDESVIDPDCKSISPVLVKLPLFVEIPRAVPLTMNVAIVETNWVTCVLAGTVEDRPTVSDVELTVPLPVILATASVVAELFNRIVLVTVSCIPRSTVTVAADDVGENVNELTVVFAVTSTVTPELIVAVSADPGVEPPQLDHVAALFQSPVTVAIHEFAKTGFEKQKHAALSTKEQNKTSNLRCGILPKIIILNIATFQNKQLGKECAAKKRRPVSFFC